MSMDLSAFFDVFYEEAEELLADMEKLLLGLDLDAPNLEDLDGIFRAAHSIKGGSATFGMSEISELTHVLESLLDLLRKQALHPTREHVDTLLLAKDVLQAMIAARRGGAPLPGEQQADLMARLDHLVHGGKEATAAPASAMPETALSLAQGSPLPSPDAQASPASPVAPTSSDASVLAGTNPSEDLVAKALQDESFGLFEAPARQPSASPGLSPAAADAEPQGAPGVVPVTAEVPVASPTPDLSAALPSAAAAAKGGEKAKPVTESSTIRVGVEKVDELINLVGELVTTHAMIEQMAKALDPMLHQRMLNAVAQLARNTRDLQDSVLGIRMLPMDVVFSRFPRMVRDLAAKLGKQIEFSASGANTELDKSLTERLVDPLTHLVRNSIDHGIEMPEVRRAAGKSETGRLTLSAAHQGGCIVIEVHDDGAGLNRERILAKARQQGLRVHDGMPDEEVWQLIFAPGFSTAEQVTDVSGRGVGMDVVKRNITGMGGTVEIQSAKGFGSSIRISLPLTLAILDGMLVKVGEEIYILALNSIIESLQPDKAGIKGVMGEGALIRVRDDYLPVVFLHQIFGIEARHTDPAHGVVVILESEGRKLGLMVDELVGQQQVVVKSLETNFRRVAGISGATVLGDGSVALILDVPTLVRQSRRVGLELTTA